MVWSLLGFEEPENPEADVEPSPVQKHTSVTPIDEEVDKTIEEAFECDYERDCTPLYRALENAIDESEFAPILKFLDTGYWPGSFFVDAIPPADQVKTWVTRFDPIDANKVKWSQLPLHLAIVCGAPSPVIGRLVKLYPQALRCTDDQHMLPVHLALRHNSSDEITAYLLMQFPDAVNAKGKNGRTAIDCALRAKNKLRGKILEIFVDKTKGKRSLNALKQEKQLKSDLDAKEEELIGIRKEMESMSAGFESLKSLKNSTEEDLLLKIQELEQEKAELEEEANEKIDRLQSEKLLEALELQKKLETLETKNAEIEKSEREIRVEEGKLREELDAVQYRVATSSSPEDWLQLKREVEALSAYRLTKSRSQAANQIETLKTELGAMEESMQGGTPTKVKDIKKTVAKLDQHDVSSKTADELNDLRSEVDALRQELKDRAEASKARVELGALKKAMEVELKNAEGKTQAELNALRQAVEATNTNALESKTNSELASMKTELETLKKDLKNRELTIKTKKELDDLTESLASEVDSADSKYKQHFTTLKDSADQLQAALQQGGSKEDVTAVLKEVQDIKESFKKTEATMSIEAETASLKHVVEEELKKSQGKTQEELLQMKKAIKDLSEKELHNKDSEELSTIKGELDGVKKVLHNLEYAAQTQHDLDELKKSLAGEIKNTTVKTEKALTMMKKAVDAVDMEQKESKNLKKSLGEEIKQQNKKTEKELVAMKKSLDSIDVKKLESTNKEGWDNIRAEMENLKIELKDKRESKLTIDTELANIKKTVETINTDTGTLLKTNDKEFKDIRQEMQTLRANLEKKGDQETVMKKEIATLKKKTEKKPGLKKFFARHFNRKGNNQVTFASPTSAAGGTFDKAALDIAVTTIAPPSLNSKAVVTPVVADDSSSDDEATDEDILDQLSASFDEPVIIETVESESVAEEKKEDDSTAARYSPSKPASSPRKPPQSPTSKFRKSPASSPRKSLEATSPVRQTRSMDPRVPTSPKNGPNPMVRTRSKTHIEDDGQVELEKVATDEDEDVITKRVSSLLST